MIVRIEVLGFGVWGLCIRVGFGAFGQRLRVSDRVSSSESRIIVVWG